MRHRDKYEHVVEFDGTQITKNELRFSRRIDEGTELFDHFHKSPEIVEKYANGYSNGYVYTTAEHEDGECDQYGPASAGMAPD
jgi:hypothetical protein